MVLNSSKTEAAYLISKNGAYQYAYNKIDNALIEIKTHQSSGTDIWSQDGFRCPHG
jgi:hypothetical protein